MAKKKIKNKECLQKASGAGLNSALRQANRRLNDDTPRLGNDIKRPRIRNPII